MSLTALFWVACVPTRLTLATVALVCGLYGAWTLLAVHAVFAAWQVLGFVEAMHNGRKTGRLGGVAWWSGLRPLHTVTHTLFLVLALLRVWWCGLLLLLDTAIGVAAWFILRPRVLREAGEEGKQFAAIPNLNGLVL